MDAVSPISEPRRWQAVPLVMVALNVVGIFLGYGATIILARELSRVAFDQYIGAIATLGLFASLAEGGFGKYGLRVIPIYNEAQDGGRIAGYLRFAFLGTLLLSLLLAIAMIVLAAPLHSGNRRDVVTLAFVYLPSMAGAGVVIDLLLAFRMPIVAMVISRIMIPATTLLLILMLTQTMHFNASHAVLCFASGSVMALLLGMLLCYRQASPLVADAEVETNVRGWISESVTFMFFTFMVSWLFRSTLVITHHMPHGDIGVGLLAPAFETGGLILLLSKSTDKFFQPAVSLYMEENNWRQMSIMRRDRALMVGAGIILFLLVVAFFGKTILGIYGPDFVASYPALCWVAVGSSMTTLFSLAPTFLLYAGRRRMLTWLLGLHAGLLLVLTVVFYWKFGGTGAAAAYAVCVTSYSLSNLYFANREFQKLKSDLRETDPVAID